MVIYNKDDIAPEYTQYANSQHMISYGTTAEADYYIEAGGFTAGRGFNCRLNHHKQASRKYILPVVGEHQLRIAAGASAVAIELGLDTEQVLIALEKFTPVSGRMNILQGIAGSTILDDSYNSSPLAVKSALKTLYRLPAKTKIAVLGDMNELGDTAAAEHQAVGELCDPKQTAKIGRASCRERV